MRNLYEKRGEEEDFSMVLISGGGWNGPNLDSLSSFK
jgi:hypothetical protein